jgi:hypothetical protein
MIGLWTWWICTSSLHTSICKSRRGNEDVATQNN